MNMTARAEAVCAATLNKPASARPWRRVLAALLARVALTGCETARNASCGGVRQFHPGRHAWLCARLLGGVSAEEPVAASIARDAALGWWHGG